MRAIFRNTFIGMAAWSASSLLPASAAACGGFFCNQAQPVNQAAEGIIFAKNDDGTVTAVIQIQYEGPSKSFSWLLPISSVPKSDEDIGIASNLAFQRLQGATNPSYSLNVKVEGTCRQDKSDSFNGGSVGSGGSTGVSAPGAGPSFDGGVTVEASGVVGAFEWTVISLDQSLADPAEAAVTWLTTNGYDVPKSAPKLLGPYLQDGLYLLALRLTKGADSGSIRPIVLTYKGTQPSIPVKLTAVAANDDMGVLTWVLGKSRSVPQNYLSLELNEARINWFNAATNYNSVVIDAANDSGGQGFVTEFAGKSSTLKGVIWTPFDESGWTSFKGGVYQSFSDFFTRAYGTYGSYDGFWDATRASVTLPTGLPFDDFKLCPNCYADQIKFAPASYLAALERLVIAPIKRVQSLIDAHPELTRMYTTLSADEMTLDPLFAYNADLPELSNVHTADRVIECNSNVYQFEAPWRVELPQGGIVRGTANDASSGTWPAALDNLPPNRVIVRVSASGSGQVVEDNSKSIKASLETYNKSVTTGAGDPTGTPGTGAGPEEAGGAADSAGGGCGMTSASGARRGRAAVFLSALALGAVLRRRRRR